MCALRQAPLHPGAPARPPTHHLYLSIKYTAQQKQARDTPSVECTATAPQPLLSGMNQFLKSLEVTFRRDPENYRPRINKLDSVKDTEQKKAGTFFYLES